MSVTDSEQQKQPISSINGQAVDINIHSPGKDVTDDQTPSVEGIKGVVEAENVKDDVGKTVELKSEETVVNGVDQSVDKKEECEPSENVTESSVEDTKPSEMQGELKHISGEGVKVETVKEGECKHVGETSTESKKSEPSDVQPVVTETNEEEASTSAESKDSEPHSDPVITETSEEKVETSAEGKESKESPEPNAVQTNKENLSSADIKESEPSHEPVASETNGVQVKTSVDSTHEESEQRPEPVAVEINGEQAKTEAVTTEVESTCSEAQKGTNGKLPGVTPSEQAENGDQLQSQTSEETETESNGEKTRATAIDSPGNVKEPDEADDKTKDGRSKIVGDIEGSATAKEDEGNTSRTTWYTGLEDTPAKANSTPANAESTSSPEETVSYSTSIVGGAVHRVPINSHSPKGQRKPGEGSPQTTPKKKSVLETLFGRRKKSKGGPESPPGSSPDVRDDKKEDQQEAEAGGSVKGVENENPQQPPESSPVTCDAGADDAVKDATEALLSGKGEEGVDTIGTDNKQEIKGKEATAVEGVAAVETKPSDGEQGEETVKDETTQDSGEPKEARIDPKEVKEDASESTPQETVKESTEESKAEGSKESVKQAETDSPDEETKPHPTLKKKKNIGLFGGFFTRRKSRKSEDSAASPPEEKSGDKVEEPQATDSSALAVVEAAGTEQGVAPHAAAEKGQEDSATPKQEAAEGVISPAVDQTVESAKDEIADKDKVDAPTVVEATVAETSEEESTLPEDVRKSSEETLPSEEAGGMAEKSAEETEKPLEAGDSQPKEGEHLVQPKIEVNNVATGDMEAVEDKPEVDEPKNDDAVKDTGEKPSPESGEAQDEHTELRDRSTLRNGGSLSHSPKTRRMQMRISYAERDGEAGKEVEVIGTPEKAPETTSQKGKADHRVSCRALGEADHEGWLAKKGGMLFLTGWKNKWVVLKDGKLYCFKTSFDLEASNVINMEGVTVAEAPETRKKFCFKCEQPGPKTQVLVFMANSKEDMDKWLTVLTAASRGEVVHKPKQNQLAVSGDVTLRRKSGSSTAQRHSSVLALGGRYDFLEDQEDLKTTRRRSTSGSLSRVPKETKEEGKETSALTATHPAPTDKQPEAPSDKPQVTSDAPASEPGDQQQVPSDTPPAPSAEQAVPSDAPSEPNGEQPAPSSEQQVPCVACTDTPSAPSDSPPAPSVACTDTPSAPSGEHPASDSYPVSGPSDEAPEDITVSEESKTTEKNVIVVVDEVFVGSDKVVVESTSTKEQVSTSESETVDAHSSQNDAASAVSNEDKERKESLKVTEEVTTVTEKQDTSTEAESAVDKTDGTASVTTTESSVVETVKTSLEISETVETSTVVSVVETVVQETSESVQSELIEGSEATTSETSAQLESDPTETTPSEDSSIPPESPSKTKWYFSLDRKQTWSIASESEEEEKSPKRSKSSTSKTSDRGSIKSTSSDKESIKSLPGDDELMVMCKNIRRARLSIVGDHVRDGPERLRAFSHAKENDEALVKLQTLERTLKDKTKHLSELEELLNQPEINRRSIDEWKLRNSDLLDELISQADGEEQDEDENAAEGGEGETQKQENQEQVGAEKEREKESMEQVEEKSNETKEEPASSKEEGDGSVDKAQAAVETEVNGDGEQKSGEDEQQVEEKEKENESILTKEGGEEQQQGADETPPPVETEKTDGKPDSKEDNSAEFSGEQKSDEEVQDSEDTFDTHF